MESSIDNTFNSLPVFILPEVKKICRKNCFPVGLEVFCSGFRKSKVMLHCANMAGAFSIISGVQNHEYRISNSKS